MSKRDFYDVLFKDADEKTLKAAYRKLAMANHPDRTGGCAAEERFREASEAYEVLKIRKNVLLMTEWAMRRSTSLLAASAAAASAAVDLPIYLTRCSLVFWGCW